MAVSYTHLDVYKRQLYIDAFGSGASITDVYVHDNTFQNESQYFLTPCLLYTSRCV